MKHLPDQLTLRHRHPLFRLSLCLSTFVSKFNIYVKVSILINYRTKQPSNLAWNISLTSWLCDIGVHFSVRLSICLSTFKLKFDIYVKVSILINYKIKQSSNLAWNISLISWLGNIGICFSVCPSVCQHLCQSSTFTSKFYIYIKVSILINYKTKQPSNLAWYISLTSWLGRYLDPVTLTYISRSSDFDTIYVNVPDLINYKACNHQTLHSASRCTDSASAPMTLTNFVSTFNVSSTIRLTIIKPCIVLLLDVLTQQIPWPIFCAAVTDTIYVNIPDLLKCKTSNHLA